jgi:hypothetical protein
VVTLVRRTSTAQADSVSQVAPDRFEMQISNVGTVDWAQLTSSVFPSTMFGPSALLLLDPSICPMLALPAPSERISPAEWQAYADDQFSKLLGDSFAQYDIELEIFNRDTRLCAAIPSTLVALLKRSRSLECACLFQLAWNQLGVQFKRDQDTWCVITSESTVQAFSIIDGRLSLFPPTQTIVQSFADLCSISDSLKSLNSFSNKVAAQIWIDARESELSAKPSTKNWAYLPLFRARR